MEEIFGFIIDGRGNQFMLTISNISGSLEQLTVTETES
jgi:hypothetical protein